MKICGRCKRPTENDVFIHDTVLCDYCIHEFDVYIMIVGTGEPGGFEGIGHLLDKEELDNEQNNMG